MPQARGSQAAFSLYEEDVYGQDPAAPAGKKLYLRTFGLQATRNQIDSETLNPDRVRSRPVRGNWDVGGNLEGELSAEAFGTLLKHAIGEVATTDTAGAAPYTHTITPGALPVGLTLEKDHGSAIAGVGRFEKFNGCRIGSLELNFPVEGLVLVTFAVRGAKSALAATALDPALDDPGHTPFSVSALQAPGTIEEGGAPIGYLQSARISIDNELDDASFALGGGGVRRALPEGRSTVSGELTALFESAALYQKAIDGDESSLRLRLARGLADGSAGNESLEIHVSRLEFQPQSPPINGPGGVLLTAPFRSYKVGADLGLTVTLKNGQATI